MVKQNTHNTRDIWFAKISQLRKATPDINLEIAVSIQIVLLLNSVTANKKYGRRSALRADVVGCFSHTNSKLHNLHKDIHAGQTHLTAPFQQFVAKHSIVHLPSKIVRMPNRHISTFGGHYEAKQFNSTFVTYQGYTPPLYARRNRD